MDLDQIPIGVLETVGYNFLSTGGSDKDYFDAQDTLVAKAGHVVYTPDLVDCFSEIKEIILVGSGSISCDSKEIQIENNQLNHPFFTPKEEKNIYTAAIIALKTDDAVENKFSKEVGVIKSIFNAGYQQLGMKAYKKLFSNVSLVSGHKDKAWKYTILILSLNEYLPLEKINQLLDQAFEELSSVENLTQTHMDYYIGAIDINRLDQEDKDSRYLQLSLLIDTMDDPKNRSRSYRFIASKFSNSQLKEIAFQKAIDNAQEIEDVWKKDSSYLWVIADMSKNGMIDDAYQLFEEYLNVNKTSDLQMEMEWAGKLSDFLMIIPNAQLPQGSVVSLFKNIVEQAHEMYRGDLGGGPIEGAIFFSLEKQGIIDEPSLTQIGLDSREIDAFNHYH